MINKEKVASFLMHVLDAEEVFIQDDSEKHKNHGHYNPNSSTHFTLSIKAEQLAYLSRLEKHKKIYELLDPFFKQGLHAVSIKTI